MTRLLGNPILASGADTNVDEDSAMSVTEANQELALLLKNLDLSALESGDREKILDLMEQKVSELLLGPREKLFQALYRLDVNESRAEQILSGRLLSAKKMSKSRALAELILDREIRKFLTRQSST